MNNGISLIKNLFFIITICIILFFVHLKIVDNDHNSCSQEIKKGMDKILEYHKNMGDIKLPSSIGGIDLSKFNLNNLNISDIDIDLTSINYIKMHYSGLNRSYDVSVAIKLMNSKMKEFSIDIPISCNVTNGETTIEFSEKNKN